MSNKLTIIKVLPYDGASPTTLDLEKWRHIFAQNDSSVESKAISDAVERGEIEISSVIEKEQDEHYITLVKVGGENYKPDFKDLEAWRDIFDEAKNDPDFKIFTHPDITIETIHVGKIIKVE